MTAQTPGEVNEQPWCFPTRFVLCRVLLPLILVSMASVQGKLLLQCAFPINRFVTRRAKKNPTKAGISYLVMSCLFSCLLLLLLQSMAEVTPIQILLRENQDRQNFILLKLVCNIKIQCRLVTLHMQ